MKKLKISITVMLIFISANMFAQIRIGGNVGVTAFGNNTFRRATGATILFPAGKSFNYGVDFSTHNLYQARLNSITTNATFIFGDHKYHVHPVLGFALGIHKVAYQGPGRDSYYHSSSLRY